MGDRSQTWVPLRFTNPVKKTPITHSCARYVLRASFVGNVPTGSYRSWRAQISPPFVAAVVTGLTGPALRQRSYAIRSMIPYLHRQLMPIAYRLAERVVAPSQGVSNALQKMGLPARKLSVISNPVGKQTDVTTSAHVDFPKRYILGVSEGSNARRVSIAC